MGNVTSKKEFEALIRKQYEELTKPDRYPELKLFPDSQGRFIVQGKLNFKAVSGGYLIKDCFEIRLEIPEDYPNSTPDVFEPKDRTINYHRSPNGTLCLTEPVEEWLIFSENPTLLHFVTKLVIPFLYRFRYCELHSGQEQPWGERSHGEEGLIEYYKKKLNATDKFQILKLLKYLADQKKKKDHKVIDHFPCPCGSGRNIRNCHAKQLRALEKVPPKLIRKVIYHFLSKKSEFDLVTHLLSRDFVDELLKEFRDARGVKLIGIKLDHINFSSIRKDTAKEIPLE